MNILVIEDDAALQEAYCFILKAHDHNVTQAFDGAEGLKLVARAQYDVILLDLHMPVMGGMEFLEKFRTTRPEHTKIIVFSNMLEPELQKKATELGAASSVLKSSVTPSVMLDLVAHA